jgi:hypothetical protein
MRLVLILLAATGVVYGIGKAVPSWKDAGAPPRWLETGGAYTHADLRTWVTTNPEFAARYVMPTLFPIDLLFMAFLAAFLASASITTAQSVRPLAPFAWLFVLIPAAYLAIDLAEDVVLANLLTHPDSITEASVGVAQVLTRLKIWAVIAAFGQTAALVVSAVVARAIGAS